MDLQLVATPGAVTFALASKGQFPNVALPEVNNHDPMTNWNSKTSKAGASLAKMVDQNCERPKSFELLDLSMSVNVVRKTKSGNKSAVIFDIWSHNQRINSLHCQILETERGLWRLMIFWFTTTAYLPQTEVN